MDPRESYFLAEEEDVRGFFEQYSSFVYEYKNSDIKLTITEKPCKQNPLRVDFDFKERFESGDKIIRKYTLKQIKKVVKIYQKQIRKSVHEDVFDDNLLYCILLEKKNPRKEKMNNGQSIIKDGFHLHFPNFICDSWFQDSYLRKIVLEKVKEKKIFDKCGYYNIDDCSFFDSVATKQWLMYGSAKSMSSEPFLISCAFNGEMSEVSLDDVFEDSMVGRDKPTEYYLPEFLSVRFNSELFVKLKDEIMKKEELEKRKNIRRLAIRKDRKEEDIQRDLKTIEDANIIYWLSDERSDDYQSWMDVGWTLFCIGQGNDEALQMWVTFSQKSEKFVEGECEELWTKMQMKGKTIASLFKMFKEDNKEEFDKYMKSTLNYYLRQSVYDYSKPNEWAIAQVIHTMYKYRFICANNSKDLWYEYVNHRWVRMDNSSTIRILMNTEVRNIFKEYAKTLKKEEDDEDKRDKVVKKASEIAEAVTKYTFQTHTLKQCCLLFYNKDFLARMDENRMIFGCDNGVLDLELGIHREGRPDDLTTLSCGISYQEYNEDDDVVQELEDIFLKIFVNQELREYFKSTKSLCLKGGNSHKTFEAGVGLGDNGKSVTYELLKKTFGEYCIMFSREMFLVSYGKSSNAPTPELVKVKGRRLGIIKEFTKDDKIDIGKLKEHTGNDTLGNTRDLYGTSMDMKDIEPQYTLVGHFNVLPKIPAEDSAMWNRMKFLPYESTFVIPNKNTKDVPKTVKEQFEKKIFHADPTIMERIKDLAPVFLWMLFKKYKEIKDKGFTEPEEVTREKVERQSESDMVALFINEKVSTTPENPDNFVSSREIFNEFKYWWKENIPSCRLELSRSEFEKRFKRILNIEAAMNGRVQGFKGVELTIDSDGPANFTNSGTTHLKNIKSH
jgi:phage/plasmid-associated DNA primase